MDKLFVIYWVDGAKSVADRIAFQIEGEIRERGIETRIKYMYGRMVIETPHIIISFLNDWAKLTGIKCDEYFNVPREYMDHVRMNDPDKPKFEGTLMDYVLLREL